MRWGSWVVLLTSLTVTGGGWAAEGTALVAGPVEASSALWQGWAERHGDHHPMFLVDGSARTGWVEGAEGDGVGEWVRLHVTPVEAAKVAVALRNGCQRTGRTFKQHGRVAKAKLTLLPSGAAKSVEVADDKGWQAFEVEQAAGPLEAVEVQIEGVHQGDGSEHACLSEVAVRVPDGVAVDAAREKARKAAVKGWVEARAAARKVFSNRRKAAEMPVLPRYVARPDGTYSALDCGGDQICVIEEGLKALKRALGAEAPAVIDRALAQMKEASGWSPVAVSVKDTRPVPAVDGLCGFDGLEAWACPQGVYLPGALGYLSASGVTTRPVEMIPTMRQLGDAQTCATYGVDEAVFARPRVGTPAALVRVTCAAGEGGAPARSAMQLLVYGDDGRLAVMASDREAAVFEWSGGEAAKLSGARKLVISTGRRTRVEPFAPIEE